MFTYYIFWFYNTLETTSHKTTQPIVDTAIYAVQVCMYVCSVVVSELLLYWTYKIYTCVSYFTASSIPPNT